MKVIDKSFLYERAPFGIYNCRKCKSIIYVDEQDMSAEETYEGRRAFRWLCPVCEARNTIWMNESSLKKMHYGKGP